MNQSRNLKKGLILVIAIIVTVFSWFNKDKVKEETTNPKTTTITTKNKEAHTNKTKSLSYKGRALILTKHARCRMGCRHITEEEIKEVLERGEINPRKSNPADPRCPTIAYEGVTQDEQKVRLIVADCGDKAKLVTVIDLKNKYNCTCK